MTARRAGDFVIYIAIGLLVGFVIFWFATHSSWSSAEIGKWFGLVANTLIVFGYTIKANRNIWKHRSFWGLILLIFAVHLIVLVSVLKRMDELKVIWWIVITPVEYFLVGTVLVATGHGPRRR